MAKHDKPSIFLAHSSAERDAARAVFNLFEDLGHHVQLWEFLQKWDDDELLRRIRHEIAANQWVVFMDSERSSKSQWVIYEFLFAALLFKRIHAISIESYPKRATQTELMNYFAAEVTTISNDVTELETNLSSKMSKGVARFLADMVEDAKTVISSAFLLYYLEEAYKLRQTGADDAEVKDYLTSKAPEIESLVTELMPSYIKVRRDILEMLEFPADLI